MFLWLPSAEAAVERVASRVRGGGHDVPEAAILRRYTAGLRNFFRIYQPLADGWQFVDNSGDKPRLIAAGTRGIVTQTADEQLWNSITSNVES